MTSRSNSSATSKTKTPNSSLASSSAGGAGVSNSAEKSSQAKPSTTQWLAWPPILDAEGYMANVDKLPDGSYRLTLHSCAIWAVASRYGLACTTELEFIQEVIPDADVTRVIHKVAGAYLCAYEIRARTRPSSKSRPRSRTTSTPILTAPPIHRRDRSSSRTSIGAEATSAISAGRHESRLAPHGSSSKPIAEADEGGCHEASCLHVLRGTETEELVEVPRAERLREVAVRAAGQGGSSRCRVLVEGADDDP